MLTALALTEKLFVSLSLFSHFCRPQSRRFLLILVGLSTPAGNSALLSGAQTKGHFRKEWQGVATLSEGGGGLGTLFFFFPINHSYFIVCTSLAPFL